MPGTGGKVTPRTRCPAIFVAVVASLVRVGLRCAALKVSIIIPVHNEERTVASLIERVRALRFDTEIIVVDDGSTDGTKEALRPYEVEGSGVRVYYSPINIGKGGAVRIGFSLAQGDIITIQDADLELDPDDLYRLIAPIVEGRAGVVYGSRFLAKDGGRLRKGGLPFYCANRILSALTNVLYGSRLTDVETCYKVFRRDVLRSLELRASGFEIDPELTGQTLRRGHAITELPITYEPRSRQDGKKIRWIDGVIAVYTLVNERFRPRSS